MVLVNNSPSLVLSIFPFSSKFFHQLSVNNDGRYLPLLDSVVPTRFPFSSLIVINAWTLYLESLVEIVGVKLEVLLLISEHLHFQDLN